ncbi:uncharacterized protein [Rutidosis leptorrhynchoides]|uniref:uncharacterized protein n=1 Tax=Rutidosis leptorrhynchoides TaxID=125765 RepID=UPI003A9A4348
MDLILSHNEELRNLPKAPGNNKLVSPYIQKDVVKCFKQEVLECIFKEIGDDVFALLVDESSDVSKKEQMAIVLRYVDEHGLVKERFVGLVHVKDTSSLSLKCSIDSFFSKHKVSMNQLRGQGYDGASNMRGLTNILSQALQRKDQDINEAVQLVEVTKEKLQDLRTNGFEQLLEKVSSFCEKHGIRILKMDEDCFNSRRQKEKITNQHYYEVECFNTVLDMQIQKFGDRFSEASTELLSCMAALHPRDSFSMFDSPKLIRLCEFYPKDFSRTEIIELKDQLEVYHLSVRKDPRFANLNGIADLARVMVETRKYLSYPLLYRLLKLALVLPVATATVERCFSAMKIVKSNLRNRIGEEFLNACVICAVEREALAKVKDEDVLQRFQNMRLRRRKV